MKFVLVAFPTAPTPFTYSSEVKNLEVGDLVAVPFRNKNINGIVLQISDKEPSYPTKLVKEIIRKNLLTDWQVKTARFISEYYAAHTGKTLRLFVPERIWKNQPLKRTTKIIQAEANPQPEKKLTADQQKALEKIFSKYNTNNQHPTPTLLHGITGSGKTEIYLRIIQAILKENKQAILLVPEIALTPQLVGYFASSIPSEKIAVIHSNLSEGQKIQTWEKIHSGEISLIIGSRSALFSPARNLAVIILDEEHEWTYKNDQTPRYHARAVALKIAELTKAKLVLGSATPSLETYYEAVKNNLQTATKLDDGSKGAALRPVPRSPASRGEGGSPRVKLIELPKRIGNSSLPEVQIVDMRNELKKKNYSPFSEKLTEKINAALAKKEQVILLLNKRGYSSSVICRDCGYALSCQNCSLPLTFHRNNERCICHSCGYFENPPTVCPECKSAAIRFLGAGTQKIESELKKLFPNARVLRADRDTTAARGSHSKIYDAFRNHEADILIGTQIVAKGLDLPKVSLVGVLLADIGLHFPDFRSAEKTFSLLTQVAGRAGRRESMGEVIIQTYSPDHPAIIAAKRHAYQKFFTEEIKERKTLSWPPFSKVIKFDFVDQSEKVARKAAENFANGLKNMGEKHIGLAPAIIPRLHNKYHWHVIWRGRDPRELLKKITLPEKCRIDVDPVNLT